MFRRSGYRFAERNMRQSICDVRRTKNMSAASAKGSVGVVGLGIMGGAIAKNLVAAGWHVVGYDIDAARTAEAKAAGVETMANAGAVAAAAETIITSLPTPAALDQTVQGIAGAKVPRRVVVEA